MLKNILPIGCGERLLEAGSFSVASCHSVIEVDAIVANAELVKRMTLRGEVLPVGGAARVPDQVPGRAGSRGLMPVLESRIMTPPIKRIGVAAGSRLMAHETPRCTSTTRAAGIHDAIVGRSTESGRERLHAAPGANQNVTISEPSGGVGEPGSVRCWPLGEVRAGVR
jgi:hypothetical protein